MNINLRKFCADDNRAYLLSLPYLDTLEGKDFGCEEGKPGAVIVATDAKILLAIDGVAATYDGPTITAAEIESQRDEAEKAGKHPLRFRFPKWRELLYGFGMQPGWRDVKKWHAFPPVLGQCSEGDHDERWERQHECSCDPLDREYCEDCDGTGHYVATCDCAYNPIRLETGHYIGRRYAYELRRLGLQYGAAVGFNDTDQLRVYIRGDGIRGVLMCVDMDKRAGTFGLTETKYR